MRIAKKYDVNYWDGERRYGYGGYQYIPGRWSPVAQALIDEYQLTSDSRVLDVGCGKGYLLYELMCLLPGVEVVGLESSQYAIENAKVEVSPFIENGRAENKFPFSDKEFDLVIAIGVHHNLRVFEVFRGLSEIERVGKKAYFAVESYRNEQELFNLQCWALTAESFLEPDEWRWLFEISNFSGDYEFIYFE